MPKPSRRNNLSTSSIHTLSQNSQVNPASISGEHLEVQMKREQVKAKVQCLVCSFSVHCGQCRREDVSLQLHAELLKDRAEVVPAISLLHALPAPRPGCCNLGNDSAGQSWKIIFSVSRGSTSAWSCKGFFLTLAI